MKKVTWFLEETNDRSFPIILYCATKTGKQINTRWKGNDLKTCREAVGLAVRLALSSKHDYGNDKVQLIISGTANLTNCSLGIVTINF